MATPVTSFDRNGSFPSERARPLKRAILREVQNPLAESILSGGDLSAGRIYVGLDGEDLTFKRI
jgi:ATP-dependent Clp protease ATP-binding subunit ClpB